MNTNSTLLTSGTVTDDLSAAKIEVAKLATWLRIQVWPLWLEYGVDWRYRGFHEHLCGSTLSCNASFRRLRVVTRQIYSFSLAARCGVPRAIEAVDLGVNFLRSNRGPDGGFPWRYDLGNRPIDQKRDLYDHAFTLLAFANASVCLPDTGLADDARATLAFIVDHLSHPVEGFLESLPSALPRRQNPHMHLLEALLAAWENFGEEVYGEIAEILVSLFLSRFFQESSGALPEYFDEALNPVGEVQGFLVEPGHHYEWAWLLAWYGRLSSLRCCSLDPRIASTRERLLNFADMFGVSARNGLVVSELRSSGSVEDAGYRLWPQAERIKCEAERVDCNPHAKKGIAALWAMIDGAPVGLWHERLSADGTAIMGPAPASSLYHLSCAITNAAETLSIPLMA